MAKEGVGACGVMDCGGHTGLETIEPGATIGIAGFRKGRPRELFRVQIVWYLFGIIAAFGKSAWQALGLELITESSEILWFCHDDGVCRIILYGWLLIVSSKILGQVSVNYTRKKA